jgi:hypothetical protein
VFSFTNADESSVAGVFCVFLKGKKAGSCAVARGNPLPSGFRRPPCLVAVAPEVSDFSLRKMFVAVVIFFLVWLVFWLVLIRYENPKVHFHRVCCPCLSVPRGVVCSGGDTGTGEICLCRFWDFGDLWDFLVYRESDRCAVCSWAVLGRVVAPGESLGWCFVPTKRGQVFSLANADE